MSEKEINLSKIPDKAYKPETPEGNEWWGMIVDGSVTLEPEKIDLLLEKINNCGEKENNS